MAGVSPTPLLLISTGGRLPPSSTRTAFTGRRRGEPVELWELAEVDHTAAIRERPEEYERRIVGLFDEALLERGE